jgi:hypothetical protein
MEGLLTVLLDIHAHGIGNADNDDDAAVPMRTILVCVVLLSC